ncbi:MAG: hypothetical protein MJ245_03590 [Clostridia bacterium]|nr:hypothetical protein [Clostridia bacterium]
MKKLEGMLTVFGVLVIIGLPMFLMFADFTGNKQTPLTSSYISVQSYADDVFMQVDSDFEQSYQTLDGLDARNDIPINDQVLSFNEEVVPLGITKDVTESKPIYVAPVADDIAPVISDEFTISEGDGEIANDEELIGFNDIILDDEMVPEGIIAIDVDNKEVIPQEETYYDDDAASLLLNQYVEMIDNDIPEAAPVIIEETFDDDSEDYGFAIEIIGDDSKEQEEVIVDDKEDEEEIIEDSDVPEAISLAGASDVTITPVEGEYNVHECTMTFDRYDEFGNLYQEVMTFYY